MRRRSDKRRDYSSTSDCCGRFEKCFVLHIFTRLLFLSHHRRVLARVVSDSRFLPESMRTQAETSIAQAAAELIERVKIPDPACVSIPSQSQKCGRNPRRNG